MAETLGEDLLRYNLKDKTFAVIDSETNGLNLFYTLPFNIGIQIYKNGCLKQTHNLYIKWPNYQIRPDLAKIVHYDSTQIEKEGREPEEVLSILTNYLKDDSIYCVGNNILGYDCMIFENYAKKLGKQLGYDYLNRLYDNNSIFKGYKLGRKVNNNDFLAWQFSLNNLVQKGLKSNVGYACKELGIEYDIAQSHGAEYDCSRSWLIFNELIKKMEIK